MKPILLTKEKEAAFINGYLSFLLEQKLLTEKEFLNIKGKINNKNKTLDKASKKSDECNAGGNTNE